MRIYKQIELLVKVIIDNKINDGGFPVAAIFTDSNGKLVGEPLTNLRKSDIPKEQSKCHEHHAEQLILRENIIENNANVLLLSILPPCKQCVLATMKKVKKLQVMYLTDDIRKKTSNEFYKKLIKDNNITIQKIELNKRWWNKIKIYYWFMIANVLVASLDHGGVDNGELSSTISNYVEKIEAKIHNEKTRREITKIKEYVNEIKERL